jgi:hypothetical protein
LIVIAVDDKQMANESRQSSFRYQNDPAQDITKGKPSRSSCMAKRYSSPLSGGRVAWPLEWRVFLGDWIIARPQDRPDYWQISPLVTMLKGLLFVSENPRASVSPWATVKV